MRKILQTLKQKWAEYLLEMIVIIVGILGAFSLNNWNENSKLKDQEKLYLERLNYEFRANASQLEIVTENHKIAFQGCKYIQGLFPIDLKTTNLDSLTKYLKFTRYRWTFNPSQGTIHSIINTSGYDVVSNSELRNLIVTWPDIYDDYLEDETGAMKFLYEDYDRYFNDHLDTKKHLDLEDPRINLKHLESKKFENLIETRALKLKFLIGMDEEGDYTPMLQHMDRIIELTTLDK